jgi:hypothetical protein
MDHNPTHRFRPKNPRLKINRRPLNTMLTWSPTSSQPYHHDEECDPAATAGVQSSSYQKDVAHIHVLVLHMVIFSVTNKSASYPLSPHRILRVLEKKREVTDAGPVTNQHHNICTKREADMR